jgi:hypothetical protein
MDQRFQHKMKLITFFNHHLFGPPGQTVNYAFCSKELKHLTDAILGEKVRRMEKQLDPAPQQCALLQLPCRTAVSVEEPNSNHSPGLLSCNF